METQWVSRRLKTLSLIGYFVMIGGMVALIVSRNVFSASPWVIVPQAGAVLLLLWARFAFGRRSFHVAANPTSGGLVTTGPYRHIRHPIYTAVSVFSVAGVLGNWFWTSGLMGGLVVGSVLLRMFCEEKLVTARYPEYRQYATTTWRMIPYVF
jgi:protein-S-isoprenylcysteine O-methyltransferase Ste14